MKTWSSLCMAALLVGSMSTVMAKEYPSKPVKFVVGFAPGGSTDMVARVLAEGLAKELGQAVVVENRPGAGGTVAAGAVARANNDGYTIFLGTVATNVINPLLRKDVSFKAIEDFTMIGQVGYYTNLILVNESSPFQDLNALVNKAKTAPLSYSSPGAGTSPHMTGEYFKLVSQAQMDHIPFNGSGPALAAVMGGHVDLGIDNLPAALNIVRSGKVKALAITSDQRIKELPEVPTTTELGFKDMSVDAWVGVMAPANLPETVTARLSEALITTLQNPDTAQKLEQSAITLKPTTPAEFLQYIKNETNKWQHVSNEANIELE